MLPRCYKIPEFVFRDTTPFSKTVIMHRDLSFDWPQYAPDLVPRAPRTLLSLPLELLDYILKMLDLRDVLHFSLVSLLPHDFGLVDGLTATLRLAGRCVVS